MIKILAILSLFIILEGTVTFLPVTLLLLIFLTVKKRETWIFPLAFLSGIFLDMFYLNNLGLTSLFFLTLVFLIFLYERKFVISSPFFVLFFSLIAGLTFMFLFRGL